MNLDQRSQKENQPENILGDIRDILRTIVPGSMFHIDQILAQHLNHYFPFIVADGNCYDFSREQGVEWAITRGPQNLVLAHLDDAFYELNMTEEPGYKPEKEESLAAKNHPDTVIIKMNRLRFQNLSRSGFRYIVRYIVIRTKDGFVKTKDSWQPQNEEETKMTERIGYTTRVLNELSRYGIHLGANHYPPKQIDQVQIAVFNPDLVAERVYNDSRKRPVWFASHVNCAYDETGFVADSYIPVPQENQPLSFGYLIRAIPNDVSTSEQTHALIKEPTVEEITAFSRKFIHERDMGRYNKELERRFGIHQ